MARLWGSGQHLRDYDPSSRTIAGEQKATKTKGDKHERLKTVRGQSELFGH